MYRIVTSWWVLIGQLLGNVKNCDNTMDALEGGL